ncbi:MAG: hypothetical protein ACRD68_08135, partial [Pyrinomonadaceae bacterium]
MKNGTQRKAAAPAAGKNKNSREGAKKKDAPASDAKRAAGGGATGDGAESAQQVGRNAGQWANGLPAVDPLNDAGELVCTSETTLTREQLLELYRYLKLTRLVE